MGLARTILAVVIALSIAALPAAAGCITVVKSAPQTLQSAMPDDCDHHGSSPAHGSKTMDDCASMGLCAAKCFNYAGLTLPHVMLGPTGSALQPVANGDLVVSQIGSPPFRPPRV
jgi:hypothetical protein